MTRAAQAAAILECPQRKQGASQYLLARLPGVALCAALASAAMLASRADLMQARGISPMIAAMAGGIALGNVCAGMLAGRCAAGIAFSKQWVLRAAIVLYGVRLSFADIARVGMTGVAVDVLMLGSTLALALFVGRLLKMDRGTVLLIGAGSSICGAAAVAATDSVVKGKPEQSAVAVATVVLYGTAAMFVYPWLYRCNLDWGILPSSASAFGVYAGSTIHEVAQVIAAARLADPGAVDAAVIEKMVRVMMLPAFLFGVALRTSRFREAGESRVSASAMPWFALGFVGVVALNSTITQSAIPSAAPLREAAIALDTLLLAMAMAALGMHTHFSCFKKAGAKAMLLAAILFLWLLLGGAAVNRAAALLR